MIALILAEAKNRPEHARRPYLKAILAGWAAAKAIDDFAFSCIEPGDVFGAESSKRKPLNFSGSGKISGSIEMAWAGTPIVVLAGIFRPSGRV